MSKIKIQGNSSGTGVVTLIAPNTNTDKTITLPDSSVTLGAATPSITDNGTTTSITLTSDGRGISQFTAKAWVNFDGTSNTGGNCTINSEHNVSSVADNGTGDHTVNFSNAMVNAYYSWSWGVRDGLTTGRGRFMNLTTSATISTTQFQSMWQNDDSNTMQDVDTACLTFFGD